MPAEPNAAPDPGGISSFLSLRLSCRGRQLNSGVRPPPLAAASRGRRWSQFVGYCGAGVPDRLQSPCPSGLLEGVSPLRPRWSRVPWGGICGGDRTPEFSCRPPEGGWRPNESLQLTGRGILSIREQGRAARPATELWRSAFLVGGHRFRPERTPTPSGCRARHDRHDNYLAVLWARIHDAHSGTQPSAGCQFVLVCGPGSCDDLWTTLVHPGLP